MAPKKRIAILTSGGDSQGMNAVIRACVRTAIHLGCDAYCVYEGYEGLVRGGELIRKTGWNDVRGFLVEEGTLIGTQRCMAFYERRGRLMAAKNMIMAGIDALIICGGDGSLTGADRFRAEWSSLIVELVQKGELKEDQVAPHRHLNIVGLVGSIDNDLSGTDATIGCYSALQRISEAVAQIGATAASHSRAFVIEVMGRHCGWLALMAGVATGADFIFIPERPWGDHWREEMSSVVQKQRDTGKRKTIVIIAEGALDRYGNKISLDMVVEVLADKKGLALDTRSTSLGHMQRGGSAVAYDRMLATLQGVEAVKAVLEATSETQSPIISINENKIERIGLMEAVKNTKEVASAIQAQDFDKAMSLRDTEFAEQYRSFMITSAVQSDGNLMLPEKQRMKIGFINVGAPAGGMNAAMRAGVAYCLSRGHEPVAIYRGFGGFVRHHADKPVGSVRPFDWLKVDRWANKGGSEIGTTRELPEEAGMEKVANLIEDYKFDALFIIGGFEAFHALSQLRKARTQYPSLCIPVIVLPATVSNNVPGTEYSIGSDTCLNQLVDFCDTVKTSAHSTSKRVFVIETQGGRSGYVAVLGGLVVGATVVYTPEDGINQKMLLDDIKYLREASSKDRGDSGTGRLVLVNEKASRVYSTKYVTDTLLGESEGQFDAKASTPGHYQQGMKASPMDRCRAVRLAIKCIEHLEKYGCSVHNRVKTDPDSAAVLGIKGASIVITPIEKLEGEETDWQNRRPTAVFWTDIKDTISILSRRPRKDSSEEEGV